MGNLVHGFGKGFWIMNGDYQIFSFHFFLLERHKDLAIQEFPIFVLFVSWIWNNNMDMG